jgi:hypothetical protein
MTSIELLHAVYQWLPAAFAFDLIVFHLIGDHPLAARWWWKRPGSPRPRLLELV